jgi:hypothetical protein
VSGIGDWHIQRQEEAARAFVVARDEWEAAWHEVRKAKKVLKKAAAKREAAWVATHTAWDAYVSRNESGASL